MAKCPICKSILGLKDVAIGRLNKKGCPSCGTKLPVNQVHSFIITIISAMILSWLSSTYRANNLLLLIIILILFCIAAICVGSLIAGYKPME